MTSAEREERDRTMEEYRVYLRQVTAIQAEAVNRLAATPALPPLEMAAMLEDIANQYLDLSDTIRELVLAPQAG